MYLQYIRAMGWVYTIMAFVTYFIQNVAFIGQNLWLSEWTNDAMLYNSSEYPAWLRDTRLGVFGALGIAQGSSLLCLYVLFRSVALKEKARLTSSPIQLFHIFLFFPFKDNFILHVDLFPLYCLLRYILYLFRFFFSFCCRDFCVPWHPAPCQCFH